MPRTDRKLVMLFAAGIVLVFVIARTLTPSPTGLGTHRQLGLPACLFYSMTGHPCPHCGMTTSFAWYARGELGTSLITNPAGTILAVTLTLLFPWLLMVCIRGYWVGIHEPGKWFIWGFVLWLVMCLIVWVDRLWS